ncbi:MAG: hypothetical protein IT321_31010 [Anaerolineae bacterium]|nr:hypothetical protein [Anaerolineae bacterium]
MSIWSINTTVQYKILGLVNEEDAEFTLKLGQGNKLASIWKPIPVSFDREGKKVVSDFIEFSAKGLTCRKSALDIILDLIQDDVEILPLRHAKEELYILNILHRVNCLDHSQSEFEVSQHFKRITKLVLQSKCPEKRMLFKIPESALGKFVHDEFKQRVESNNLTGLIFKYVTQS